MTRCVGQTTLDVTIPYGFVTGHVDVPIFDTQSVLLLASEGMNGMQLWTRLEEQQVIDGASPHGVRGVTLRRSISRVGKHSTAHVELGAGVYSFVAK